MASVVCGPRWLPFSLALRLLLALHLNSTHQTNGLTTTPTVSVASAACSPLFSSAALATRPSVWRGAWRATVIVAQLFSPPPSWRMIAVVCCLAWRGLGGLGLWVGQS